MTAPPRRDDADDADDATFVAVVEARQPLAESSSVAARSPESAVHLFDARSGTALRNRRIESYDDAVNV